MEKEQYFILTQDVK